MALGGLHLSVEQVKADKHARNERQVKELQAWIETTLGEKIQGSLIEALKDGQVLCRLINKIAPNTVKKINKEASPFKQRENIEAYLHACQDLGMAVTDCFPVVDLFEDRDTNSVYANLSVLRIIANKLSSSSPRNGANNPSTTKGATVILTVSTNNPTGRASADAKSPRIPGPVRRPSAADERRPSNAELRPPPPVSTPSLNESLAAKKLEKYDKELEQELRRWLESVLGETTAKDRSFAEVLKDGVLLCRLINKLKPGSITKINEQRTPFKQMENIEAYLTACKELGIAELDSFNTVDLYEEKNMNLVLVQMSTLATHAAKIPEWKGAVPFKREVVVVGGERSRGDTVERKKHRKEPRALRHLRKGNWESAKGEIVSGKFALKDTDSLGQTALHIAADGGLVDFIQWALTQPGANINAKDKDGYTPLATAVQHLRFDVAELLIEKGADLTLQSNDGSTVLHLLARLPNTPAVVKLVDIILQRRVALTEISDRALDTPLMVAAGSMNDGVLMCLLKRGATLGGTNTLGDTALHKACRLVEQDEAAIMLCKALVDNGIALTPKNAEGRTAFELLPAAARKELERHTAASASDKALSPRSVADLRLQRSKKNMTPRGSYANITPDPVYRIELGESVPLDIELIQMPYYYRWNFAGRKHTNFAGYLDEEHADAIFISVMEEAPGARILVRTKDGTVETVEAKVKQPYSAEAVLNDLIAKRPAWKSAVFLQVDNLKLQSDLLDAEERDPQRTFRFPIGVVYSAAGNKTQWEMWDNEHGSKEFEQFCQFLGERIRLKGWTGYTGSLDVKNDTKGSESIFTKFHGFDIMFHVSTFLPYDPKDDRKLARSRMIGNDITMIIYQEGDTPYAPSTMTGGVSHVFVVVRPIKDKTTGAVKYSLSCVSKDYVPAFKPDIPEPALFQLDEVFRNLILAKLINGHSAAQSSPGLRMMYTRPRQAMLADLATVYCKNIDVRIAREKGKVKPRGLLKM